MASEFNQQFGSLHVAVGQACPRSPASDTGVHRATRGGAWTCGLSPGAARSWCCPQVTSQSLWNTGGLDAAVESFVGRSLSQASSGEGRASPGLVG